ncbi:hypothetical protein DFR58_13134 [Anaerobacterium chartisolvens]|uniref:Uncharacterized protein n=1 Tax=Anaerobacterium chartisolvens TaxID=1297424 RepID=A0A369AKW0_9FIRM|nr:hypothetical protein DFR58_13134 [Anaerobacterium chartisolvens]
MIKKGKNVIKIILFILTITSIANIFLSFWHVKSEFRGKPDRSKYFFSTVSGQVCILQALKEGKREYFKHSADRNPLYSCDLKFYLFIAIPCIRGFSNLRNRRAKLKSIITQHFHGSKYKYI